MKAKIYAIEFIRKNYYFAPSLSERVVVILETRIPFDLEDNHVFMDKAWAALWKQYPLWNCPYHQGNPPPNKFEKIRHEFSSAFVGEVRCLTDEPEYRGCSWS